MYAHVSATCFLHAKCDRIWTVVTERIRLGLLREKPKLRRAALYDMELGNSSSISEGALAHQANPFKMFTAASAIAFSPGSF